MKKLFLLTASVTMIFSAQAQTKKVSFVLKSGINFAHYDLPKINTVGTNKGSVKNFQEGLVVNVSISNKFIVQPGLLINGKGGKTQSNLIWRREQSISHTIYLELPINFIYRALFLKRMHVFLGGGPYLALGMGGKNIYNGASGDFYNQNYSGSNKIKFKKVDQHSTDPVYNFLNPFDYGLNILSGLQYKNFQLSINYGVGIKDVRPNGSNYENMGKNRVLSFGAGYVFTF